MASYAQQVLISTGKDDWKSKIEDEEDAVLVRQLKKFLTRGGKYVDVRGRSLDFVCPLSDADRYSIALQQPYALSLFISAQ
jgi:hypothetical protein